MEQVYVPQVISDTPFPTQDTSIPLGATQTTANQNFSPQTIKEQGVPTKRIAVELISDSLNTRSKKILGEFQFTPSGALQIGDYTQGVNGDVRISPNGITARDLTGSTTFDLDGTTGDATFAGTIQSGALVAGQVAVGDDAIQIDGENRRIIFYDTSGIPVIVIGQP